MEKRFDGAKVCLDYKTFGFEQTDDKTWVKYSDQGPVTYKMINHADHKQMEGIVKIQRSAWGLKAKDIMPVHVLCCSDDIGFLLVAGSKRLLDRKHPKPEGFAFSIYGSDNNLFLYMLGVLKEIRYQRDLGFNLALLQSIIAKERQISAVNLVYDPLRGGNARVYIEKLGGIVDRYIVDKYGKVPSKTYGEEPTDRFVTRIDLNDQDTVQRLLDVEKRRYNFLSLDDVDGVEELSTMAASTDLPPKLKVEIPGDVDNLEDEDKKKWRDRVRTVATSIMVSEPQTFNVEHPYIATGFATGMIRQERKSYYLFQRAH